MPRSVLIAMLVLSGCPFRDDPPPTVVPVPPGFPTDAGTAPIDSGTAPDDSGPIFVDGDTPAPDAVIAPDGSVEPGDGSIGPDGAPPPFDADIPGFEETFGDEECIARLELELGWAGLAGSDEEFLDTGARVLEVAADQLVVLSGMTERIFRWAGPSLTSAFMVDDVVTIERTAGEIEEHSVRGEQFAATIARTTREVLMVSIEPFEWSGIEFGAHSERERCGIDRGGPMAECGGAFGDEALREMTPTVNGRNALVGMSFTISRTSFTVAQATFRTAICAPRSEGRLSIARLEVLEDAPPIPGG